MLYKLLIRLNSPMHIRLRTIYGYRSVQDVPHDEYGFPYIPSSEIRGCLRNACRDLKGLGINVDEDKIFGRYDERRSSLIVYDAVLSDYRFLRSAAINARKKNYDFPMIINHYTRLRPIYSLSHTSYIRTINKGLTFVSFFGIDQKYLSDFRKIVKALKAIGKYKSYGLGEVSCSIDPVKPKKNNALVYKKNKNYSRINIRLTNLSKLTLRETYDLFNWTKSYIPGSSILGYLSSRLNRRLDNIKCSNLYLVINGKRSFAAPQCFYTKKIDDTILCDKFSKGKRKDDTDQLCKLSNYYLDSLTSNHINYAEVDTSEITYHGINTFYGARSYNISSIKPYHKFDGFIEGDSKTLKLIYDELVKNSEITIGSFITRGYGRCQVEIVGLEEPKTPSNRSCNEFIVVLNSETYLKNENNLYTTKSDYVKDAISKLLKKELVCIENFQTYKKVANYDYLKHCARNHIFCLDMGSIYHFKTKDGSKINIAPYEKAWIGELNNIGFGELVFLDTNGSYYRSFHECNLEKEEKLEISASHTRQLVSEIIEYANNRFLISSNPSCLINKKKLHNELKTLSVSKESYIKTIKDIIAIEIKEGEKNQHEE